MTTSSSASTNQEPYAILSVGGFLGMGQRLVAVPFKELHAVADKRLRMEGASNGEPACPTGNSATPRIDRRPYGGSGSPVQPVTRTRAATLSAVRVAISRSIRNAFSVPPLTSISAMS